MVETPDFEQLARTLIEDIDRSEDVNLLPDAAFLVPLVAEQLRLVWNARGAADLATIETSLSSQMGSTASGPYLKNLDRELRKLDR